MRTLLIPMAALAMAGLGCSQKAPAEAPVAAAPAEVVKLDHVLESIDGGQVDLAGYRGKALLIVNTASECGLTPQYEGLQKLHERYADRGLVVIGIPSNDFGGQEPGGAEEIKGFCESRFGVTFPMMAKVHAKGPEIAPIYATLTARTSEALRGEVKWNFTKFLVDAQGVPVARFEPRTEPLDPKVIEAIEKVLPN